MVSPFNSPFQKMKRDENNISRNLLDILVGDLKFGVMQHLNGKDLLNLSEVSREWSQLVAENMARKGQQKIRLVIDETRKRCFDSDIIFRSIRNYTSIRVLRLYDSREHVSRVLLDSTNKFEEIQTYYDFDMNEKPLPEVMSLFISANRLFEHGLLSSVTNLTKLTIILDSKHQEKIIECLDSNPRLEKLALDGSSAKIFFKLPIGRPLNISLTSFKIADVCYEPISIGNYFSFLLPQVNSIKEIKLMDSANDVLFDMLHCLPNLQRVTFSPMQTDIIFYMQRLREQRQRFEELLPNIVEMNLIDTPLRMAKVLLMLTPNLKKLYVSELTLEVLRYAILHNMALKKIIYCYVRRDSTIEEIEESYEEDKQSFGNINRNIVLSQI